MKPLTLAQWVEKITSDLSQAAIQCADPREHAKQILCAVLNIEAVTLYTRWEEEVTNIEWQEKIEAFVSHRCQGVPFQYLVGYEWFWNFRFQVGPGVLIPRRETEHLVEAVLETAKDQPLRIAELGPGSGNIGISILSERLAEWFAYEINPESVKYLRANLNLISTNSYHWKEGDFFELALNDAPFDLIVTNPPYVASETWSELSLEVLNEPTVALEGGKGGTEVLERLLKIAPEILVARGWLMCELGEGQAKWMTETATKYGFENISFRPDYAGISRVFIGQRK